MKQSMGEFLATLRRANGYTQQEVAEKLGVSNRTLSSWETDRTAPDLLVLPAIADLYGVTVDEILRGERRAAEEKQNAISEDSKSNLKKRRFAKFGTRRLLCLGFALLGSLIFLAACAVLLYSSAPLWLSVLLMVIGAGGCIACVILTACFAYSAIKAEGLVLKEDYTDEKKPYAFCVRHSVANSLFWLSLPHILGVIVFLIVFFAAGYYDYRIIMGGVRIEIDYTTPTVTLVCLNAAFALAFFVSGLILSLTGVLGLGADGQRAAVKSNGKLLGKIAGFSAIPVVVALIALIVCVIITPVRKVEKVYFEAKTTQEVYEHFQTYTTGGHYKLNDEGEEVAYVPAGKYYLNFQSDEFVELKDYESSRYNISFRVLGNGFYARGYAVYHLDYGVIAEDVVAETVYWKYLNYVDTFSVIRVNGIDVVNAARYPQTAAVDNDITGLYVWCEYALNYSGNVYRYEAVFYYEFSELAAIIFWTVVGGTVIADTIAYFIKRKRTEYSF